MDGHAYMRTVAQACTCALTHTHTHTHTCTRAHFLTLSPAPLNGGVSLAFLKNKEIRLKICLTCELCTEYCIMSINVVMLL